MENQSRFKLIGYSLLGDKGNDGIRYVWSINGRKNYIESAAFNKRTKIIVSNDDNYISAYTTSISSGCILKSYGKECRFCRTGRLLPYNGHLTSLEIAIQNIMMVLADINCNEHAGVNRNMREFAYMGQGEPGFSYPQIRSAIKITDHVMKKLGQKVYRHIIATCGVTEMIDLFCNDLKNKFFGDTRVTLHYSLNSTQMRKFLMPIDNIYPYTFVLKRILKIRRYCNEKPCVSILLFNNFKPSGENNIFNTDNEMINDIISILNPNDFRISLCDFNEDKSLGTNEAFPFDKASELESIFKNNGYETKLFASFGKKEDTGCGLLGGVKPNFLIGDSLKQHYFQALKLVNEYENL